MRKYELAHKLWLEQHGCLRGQLRQRLKNKPKQLPDYSVPTDGVPPCSNNMTYYPTVKPGQSVRGFLSKSNLWKDIGIVHGDTRDAF